MVESRWLGRISYEDGLRAQDEACAAVETRATVPIILGLEHTATITLGKRGNVESDLPVGIQALEKRGFEIARADRGGQATLHSPGQLVIYPIVPLRPYQLGARAYVEILEASTRSFLADLGVTATRKADEPGLYTAAGKLAFFGIRIRNGITRHGLSINVSNDLGLFAWIRSCGRPLETFDRLQAHGCPGPLNELFSLWVRQFSAHLQGSSAGALDSSPATI